MSDIKLFRLVNGLATELRGDASDLEKPLQTLIENNLEPLLGIRFLASEYFTGKIHNGRIDSLGLDENSCPVILEYKRSIAESVINQGLYYLAWLMDHQAEPINARGVRNTGHWGTGDSELPITEDKDLDAVNALIQQAYEGRAI